MACSDPARRDFDFWIGNWEVRNPAGEVVGHNRIRRTVNGCGLREEWRGRRGLRGTSLNSWSAERGVWHQIWIDSAGSLLLLEGGMRDGTMVLEGNTIDPEKPGVIIHSRISWSVVGGDPDRVRQHWQTSSDGRSWETVFDGHYVRLKAP
jgi:hypothetical protein